MSTRDGPVVAVIPARGGSKAIPRKNLLSLCGRPLLEWSILQARAASGVDEVLVSSDDPEILAVAAGAGATPVPRPAELATDTASSEEALLHALDWIEARAGRTPAAMVFLQATSPLREPADIEGALRTFVDERADALFTVSSVEDFCIWRQHADRLESVTYDYLARGRRQDRPPLWLENGSIYVFRPSVLRAHQNRLGGRIVTHPMEPWKSWEIDSPEDVDLVAFFFEKHGLDRLGATGPIPAEALDLVVYDFDGVMTDNTVLVTQDGTEGVVVNRADGLGVDRIRRLGIPQLILSTERSPVVGARARKLGIEVVQNCPDKAKTLSDLCRERGIPLARVAFIANDVNDLSALRMVGYPVAPSDAHADILRHARFRTRARGGAGVVREFSDLIIGQKEQ